MVQRTRLFGWCSCLGFVLLTGCAAIGGSQESDPNANPSAAVTARADARWKALIAGDLEKAYGYLSPSTRQVITLNSYRVRVKPGMWIDSRVKSVTCAESLCTAVIMLKYNLGNIKGLEKEVEESWIKDLGNWWFVEKK